LEPCHREVQKEEASLFEHQVLEILSS
jgi:hypothetical protein